MDMYNKQNKQQSGRQGNINTPNKQQPSRQGESKRPEKSSWQKQK